MNGGNLNIASNATMNISNSFASQTGTIGGTGGRLNLLSTCSAQVVFFLEDI